MAAEAVGVGVTTDEVDRLVHEVRICQSATDVTS